MPAPSSPGSLASLREPYAWWKTTLPPCPISTTAPGSLCAAMESFTSLETAAKSGVGTATGGNAGAVEVVWPARCRLRVSALHV